MTRVIVLLYIDGSSFVIQCVIDVWKPIVSSSQMGIVGQLVSYRLQYPYVSKFGVKFKRKARKKAKKSVVTVIYIEELNSV